MALHFKTGILPLHQISLAWLQWLKKMVERSKTLVIKIFPQKLIKDATAMFFHTMGKHPNGTTAVGMDMNKFWHLNLQF